MPVNVVASAALGANEAIGEPFTVMPLSLTVTPWSVMLPLFVSVKV